MSLRGKAFAKTVMPDDVAARLNMSEKEVALQRHRLERQFDAATRPLARAALLGAKYCDPRAYNKDTGETLPDEIVRFVKEYT